MRRRRRRALRSELGTVRGREAPGERNEQQGRLRSGGNRFLETA
jgi:hypothetical protein